MIRHDPTLVDLTSNFCVLFTNLKVYHSGWSLAYIIMKEMDKLISPYTDIRTSSRGNPDLAACEVQSDQRLYLSLSR